MSGRPRPLEVRFWEKVSPPTASGCREWLAATNKDEHRQGYGLIRHEGRMLLAHRVAWEFCRGPIPEGLCVLHRCDNTLCVNSEHLFLGDHGTNAEDREQKRRNHQTQKTHCPKGHPYSGENLYLSREGTRRECRICKTSRQKKRSARG